MVTKTEGKQKLFAVRLTNKLEGWIENENNSYYINLTYLNVELYNKQQHLALYRENK